MNSPHVKTSERKGAWTWIKERVSSLVLIPLTLWAVVMGVAVTGMSHAEALAYVASPLNATAIVLILLIAIYHMHLGFQVIIEDYLHGPAGKLSLAINAIACIALAAASLVVVILIASGSAPAGA